MFTQTLSSDVTASQSSRSALLIGAVLATSLLSATPAKAGDYDAAGEPYRPGVHGWALVEHQNGQAVELTRRSGDGALSTVCSDGQCNIFIEPDSACLPGVKYPVLLNSARQMGVLSGTCRLIADSNGPRLVVHLQQKEALFRAMARGDDLSLAFPTMNGEMDVIEVGMKGVLPMLQAAVGHRSPTASEESSAHARKPGRSRSRRTYRQARQDESLTAVDVAVSRTTTRYYL